MKEKWALTREDLDGMGCSDCGDDLCEFFFHARCHSREGLGVSYDRSGVLILRCNHCEAEIVRVAVAGEAH